MPMPMPRLMPDKPHLLMVDDNDGDLCLVRIALENAGIEVEFDTALNGLIGQDHLKQLVEAGGPLPKAVLLDLNMPRMDGRQLLKWIRSAKALQAMPVIMFTSSNDAKERTHCMGMGATDYWVKPTRFEDYSRMVARLVVYFEGAPT